MVLCIAPERTISEVFSFPACNSVFASCNIPVKPASRNNRNISVSDFPVRTPTSRITSFINAPDCFACFNCHSAVGVILPVFAILRATSRMICSFSTSHIPRYPEEKLFKYSGVSTAHTPYSSVGNLATGSGIMFFASSSEHPKYHARNASVFSFPATTMDHLR